MRHRRTCDRVGVGSGVPRVVGMGAWPGVLLSVRAQAPTPGSWPMTLTPGSWTLTPGIWILDSDSWNLDPGLWNLRNLRPWLQGLISY